MSRYPDEYPTAVIELKLAREIRRIKKLKAEERQWFEPPTPPVPIREMTDAEEREYRRR